MTRSNHHYASLPRLQFRRMPNTCVVAAITILATVRTISAQQISTPEGEVTIDQRLDTSLPLDLEFRNASGEAVRLGDYFDNDQPVIVTPVYYRCPMLCGLELNGLVRCLRAMELSAGTDFQIVTFSIDPTETPSLAAQKKKSMLSTYARPGADEGWHFLTGDERNVRALCDALGFKTVYDEETGQYAHAAGIMVATPEGRLARYFYGVEFPPGDLRLALVEASENRIGGLADQVILYCYLYDPTTGKYGLAIMNLVRVGGILTFAALAIFITRMLWRERAASRRAPATAR